MAHQGGARVDDDSQVEQTELQTLARSSGTDLLEATTAIPRRMLEATTDISPKSPVVLTPPSPTPSTALPPIRLMCELVEQTPVPAVRSAGAKMTREMLEAPTEVTELQPAAASGASPVMPPGASLPRYEILRALGEGAFGRVVAARDTKLGRVVALKVLHDEHAKNEEVRQRFVQEAHAAGCIGHPGIVTVFDVGELEGTTTPFIAMELLVGESLQARIERTGPMPSARVREIGRQVASALASAHHAGVIHRDLKPDNLFVVADSAAIGGERIKILDFGLAKPQLIAASVKTRAGSVFGTPAYMSPEQFLSTRDTGHRSDIYSFGCILYHLVTGQPPFKGAMYELVKAHRSTPPPSLRAFVPDASASLDALIQRMLAKDPMERPHSMTEVEEALAVPEAPPRPEPAPEPARSRWSLRNLFGSR
jgi:serine/threonine-protein kinase